MSDYYPMDVDNQSGIETDIEWEWLYNQAFQSARELGYRGEFFDFVHSLDKLILNSQQE